MWTRLRNKQLGIKFRRQAVILGYIVDFYCPEWRFVVEVDGDSHRGREAQDAYRDRALARRGFRTLRLPAALVEEDLDAAVARIRAAVSSR